MYRFAYRLCGSPEDAEELGQCFLASLFPKLERIEKIEKLSPWLSRGLYNLYVDGYRRRQRENTLFDTRAELQESSDNIDTTFAQASSAELSSQIELALAQLNPDQRIVVLLHDSEGYTLDELSRILEVPLGTLKSRLNRAHRELIKLLATEPFDDPVRVKSMGRLST